MKDFTISIIIPVYNEGQQIQKNLRKVHDIMCENSIYYEFIVIDDGSSDDTWKELEIVSKELPAIHLIRFSRNYGKEAALFAGIEAVDSDACIIMDSDLQHPPELIPEMVRLWKEEGYDVIEGEKSLRGKEGIANKLGASVFYGAFKKLSGYDLNRASDFKLLDSKVIDALQSMPERNTFFRGMSIWVGYKRKSIPFVVQDRKDGRSKWSIFKLSKLAIDAIISFSSLPLQMVTLIGMTFFIGALILGVQTIYMKVAGIAFSGFTTVILLLLIMGSALMISLGIIGNYIAKIFDEVKGRPRYLIKEEKRKN
jgi:polyisoprenyl-phosphate glycosyltransferase